MIKMSRIIGVMCAGFMYALAIFATHVMAGDSDGCWSGRHSGGSCLKYESYEENNKTYIILTNLCNDRLYVKWCANDKCGADSLNSGQTKKKYEYVTNARVRAIAVGSNISSKDWVCAGKVSGWNDW